MFACSLLGLPVFYIVINSNEKAKNEKKRRREGEGNTQHVDVVTIATGKLYPYCQNLISSVCFPTRVTREESEQKTDIKMLHKQIWSIH